MKNAYRLAMAPCRIAVQNYTDTEEGGRKMLRNVGHYLPIDLNSHVQNLGIQFL